MNKFSWLPKKITRDNNLIENAYLCFIKDFKSSNLRLAGKKVIINSDNKITFKHLTTQGQGHNREHCNQRCERIPWIKAIIKNANTSRVKMWKEKTASTDVYYLALEDFSYLVVLKSSNPETIGLATAYCIDDDYKRDLSQRYDGYKEKNKQQTFKKERKQESLDDIYEHFLKFDES